MTPEEMIGRTLREGHTTGATAAGAMKAAILAIRGEFPKQVSVLSPQRKEIVIPVESASAEGLSARLLVSRMPEMIWTARMALPLLLLLN